MGLLYKKNNMNFSDLVFETRMDSNKLAYHLNVLLDVGLIKKKNGKYFLLREGKKLLTNLGFIDKIEKIYRDQERVTLNKRPAPFGSTIANPLFFNYNLHYQEEIKNPQIFLSLGNLQETIDCRKNILKIPDNENDRIKMYQEFLFETGKNIQNVEQIKVYFNKQSNIIEQSKVDKITKRQLTRIVAPISS